MPGRCKCQRHKCPPQKTNKNCILSAAPSQRLQPAIDSPPSAELTGALTVNIVMEERLTLSGPGGGLRGPDGQTHSCQSETSYPMMPKLGDF